MRSIKPKHIILIILGVILILLFIMPTHNIKDDLPTRNNKDDHVTTYYKPAQSQHDSLNVGRPETATLLPDFTGEITDLRITAVPRNFEVDTNLWGAKYFEDIILLQIYYGYQSDGVWYDIPCENYDLKGIFYDSDYTGFDAGNKCHLVQIGPYVLICYIYDFYQQNYICELYDNLGSEVLQPFTEYYTPFEPEEGKQRYGYIKEVRESIISGDELEYEGNGTFRHFSFLILDLDSLLEDYEVYVVKYAADNPDDREMIHTLTIDEIRGLLGEVK